MSEKWTEQILESMLEEVLSKQHPPDLTARIAEAWRQENSGISVTVPSADTSVSRSNAARAGVRVGLAKPRNRKLHRRKTWVAPLLSIAASGLLVVVSWQYWLHTADRIAQNRVSQQLAQQAAQGNTLSSEEPFKAEESAVQAPAIVQAPTIALNRPGVPKSDLVVLDGLPLVPALGIEKVQSPSSTGTSSVSVAQLTDKQIVQLIDSQLKMLWGRLGITPTPTLNRAGLIRKTGQELTGPAVSSEFVLSQMANNDSSQRADMVRSLTESANFAQFWADRFASRLLAGTGAANSESEAGKTLRSTLGLEIIQQTPWNKVIASLVHSQVLESPAANLSSEIFLTSLAGKGNHRLASRIGTNMLDQSVGCAQCHSSPAGHSEQAVEQEQFWSLVASLYGLESRDTGGKQLRSLVDTQAEIFANNNQPNVFFELPDGRVKNALAQLPNGEAWNSSATATTPRQALADWMVDSPQVDRAIVNQVWHFVFGRRLVPQLAVQDEVGFQEREELLHALALQLRAHDHSLPQLVGWLVQSDAFTRQPLPVDRQKWLNADDTEFEKWNKLESVFASAGTLGNSIEAKSLNSSLAAVLKWNGLEGTQDRSTLLAQPSVSNNKKAPKKAATKPADSVPSASYLVHANWHTPAQRDYIRRVAGSSKLAWRDQVQHVVGLTGDYWLSPSVEKLADQILAESSKNVESALLQLLWAVSNSDAS